MSSDPEKQHPSTTENGNGESKKRAKIDSLLQELLLPGVLDREEEIRKSFADSKPYPHAQIQNLFQPDFLTAVKDEIKSQSKVTFKESDLFRVYQSIDMGNLKPGSELAEQLPDVMKLREILYSQEWRSFVERLAGLPPSTLISQIDCACNCHAPGCHLLCHDDVIGTRKVSYIIYLTEPDWKEEEGGSLELYGPQTEDGDKDDSSPLPVARVWPTFNSMAFFVVEPGHSYHAVGEVLGDRPRLSLQGWYHAAEPPDNIELATLQQLKSLDSKNHGDAKLELEFQQEDDVEAALLFTEKDKEYLSKYLKEEYLTEDAMNEVQKKFENDSSVQFRNFLQDKWVPKMEPQKPSVYDESYYKSGISSEWKLRGPAHKQRYLEYQPDADSAEECQMIGDLLHHVKTKVFESEQLARYLHRVTSLEKPTGIRSGQIRRFRPGLDYTVAHYGLLMDQSVLDATMCFVYDDNEEKDVWECGDSGGFECYIEADDDEDDTGGAADEYNEDDDTELLSVSASNNTLSLVYRDPGTMRFVKYVGSSAPSSRYDICMEYEVPEGEDEDNEEDNVDELAEEDGAKAD
jgi:Rps23 Pro-64 3,4-dihydroxylase Tpa1-like proline 4-hydroxylase